jgi:hypothetical protein
LLDGKLEIGVQEFPAASTPEVYRLLLFIDRFEYEWPELDALGGSTDQPSVLPQPINASLTPHHPEKPGRQNKPEVKLYLRLIALDF